MNVALDTNAYSDFMRGIAARVELLRTVRSIVLPLIVLGELRAGFAAGNRESTNATNLQRFLASPRVCVLAPDEQTTHCYAQLHRQLATTDARYRRTTSGSRPSPSSTISCSARPTATSGRFRSW